MIKLFRRKPKKFKVKLSEFGPVPLNFTENEWEVDPNFGVFTLTLHTKIIDCNSGGTCSDKQDGGFKIELIPID